VSDLSELFEQLADGPRLSRPTPHRSTPMATTAGVGFRAVMYEEVTELGVVL
jgi:hypothetical protein